MAIALANGPTDAAGTTSVNVSITGATAGNQVVVVLRWTGSATGPTVTLTGETVTLIGTALFNSTLNESRQLGYVKSLASGGAKTLSLSGVGSGQEVGATYLEFSGGDTASWYDGVEGGTSSASASGGNLTLTTVSDHDLIVVGGANSSSNGHIGADTGYTATAVSSINWADDVEENPDVGLAGSKTINYTSGTSGAYLCKGAAFKPAGGAATHGLKRNANLDGLGASGPFFSDPLAA